MPRPKLPSAEKAARRQEANRRYYVSHKSQGDPLPNLASLQSTSARNVTTGLGEYVIDFTEPYEPITSLATALLPDETFTIIDRPPPKRVTTIERCFGGHTPPPQVPQLSNCTPQLRTFDSPTFRLPIRKERSSTSALRNVPIPFVLNTAQQPLNPPPSGQQIAPGQNEPALYDIDDFSDDSIHSGQSRYKPKPTPTAQPVPHRHELAPAVLVSPSFVADQYQNPRDKTAGGIQDSPATFEPDFRRSLNPSSAAYLDRVFTTANPSVERQLDASFASSSSLKAPTIPRLSSQTASSSSSWRQFSQAIRPAVRRTFENDSEVDYGLPCTPRTDGMVADRNTTSIVRRALNSSTASGSASTSTSRNNHVRRPMRINRHNDDDLHLSEPARPPDMSREELFFYHHQEADRRKQVQARQDRIAQIRGTSVMSPTAPPARRDREDATGTNKLNNEHHPAVDNDYDWLNDGYDDPGSFTGNEQSDGHQAHDHWAWADAKHEEASHSSIQRSFDAGLESNLVPAIGGDFCEDISPQSVQRSFDSSSTRNLSPVVGVDTVPPLLSSSEEIESDINDDENPVRKPLAALIADIIYNPSTRFDRPRQVGVRVRDSDANLLDDAPQNIDEFLDHPALQAPNVLRDARLHRQHPLDSEEHDFKFRQRFFSGFSPADNESIFNRLGFKSLPVPTDDPDHPRRLSFDIDSVLGQLYSLGGIRCALKVLSIQTPTPRIKSDLHLATFPTIYVDDPDPRPRSHARCINDIPHITLGRLDLCDDYEIMIMFPNAARPNQQSPRLPDPFFERWYNQVWAPSVFETLPSEYLTTFPATAEEAKGKAELRSAQLQKGQETAVPRQQLLSYLIPSQFLGEIWRKVLRRVISGRDHLMMFRGLWLFVNAKGLKHRLRGFDWDETMNKYEDHQRQLFSDNAFEWRYQDLGYLFTPPYSRTEHSQSDNDGEPEVLLWDRDYLEQKIVAIQALDTHFKHTVKLYSQYFLPRTGAITIEPAARSALRGAGLLYAQFYNPVKDFWSAGDEYLASAPHLTDLAQDPRLIRVFQQIAQAKSVDLPALLRTYAHVKYLVDEVCGTSIYKSAPIRGEFRVDDDLLAALSRKVRQTYVRHGTLPSGPCPAAYFSIATPTFLRWVWWNVNRLCYGFEFIYRSVSPRQFCSYEQTRAMNTFLRALPCFFGHGPIGQYSRFWLDKLKGRHRTPPPRGWAMQRGMDRTNFPWFAYRFNFHSMTFSSAWTTTLGFFYTDISRRLRRHGHGIRQFQRNIQYLDQAKDWLTTFKKFDAAIDLILDYLLQACALEFRRSVFEYLHDGLMGADRRQVINEQYRDDAISGRLSLCFANLKPALRLRSGIDGLQIKSHRKDKFHTYDDVFNALFDPSHMSVRLKRLPYYTYLCGTMRAISQCLGSGDYAVQFWNDFADYIRLTHWLLPYPGNNRLILRDPKTKQFGFFSMRSLKVQVAAKEAGPDTSFLRHPEWRDDFDEVSCKWKYHAKSAIPNPTPADTDLLDMEPDDFHQMLREVSGTQNVDENADNEDVNGPQLEYTSSSATESEARSRHSTLSAPNNPVARESREERGRSRRRRRPTLGDRSDSESPDLGPPPPRRRRTAPVETSEDTS